MAQHLSDYSFLVKKSRERRVFSVIAIFIFVFAFILIVRHTVFFSVRVRSLSMAPDIPKNAFVLCTPILAGLSRGDVILVKAKKTSSDSPFLILCDLFVRFFTANQMQILRDKDDSSASPALRRLIGLPGDTLYMKGQVVFVKPKGAKHFLTEFEYGKQYAASIEMLPSAWDDDIGLAVNFDERVLGDGEYFVLADNRTSSLDSRVWGVIPKSELASRAVLEFLPISHFKFF